MDEIIRLEIPELVYKKSGIDPFGTTAKPEDVLKGKTFYSNSYAPITGTLDLSDFGAALPEQEKTVSPSVLKVEVLPDEGYTLSKVTLNPVTSSIDSNIQAYNIRKGVSILGVVGNLEIEAADKPIQEKVVDPDEVEKIITADPGFELKVILNPIPKDYVGSGVRKEGGKTFTATTETQKIIDANTFVEGDIILDSIKTESREVKSTTELQKLYPTEGQYINEIVINPIVLETKTLTPSTENQEFAPSEGFDGIEKIVMEAMRASLIPNLLPANVRKGVKVLDIEGSLELDRPDQTKTVTPSEQEQRVSADAGYELVECIVNAIPNNYLDITNSNNIYTGQLEVVG